MEAFPPTPSVSTFLYCVLLLGLVATAACKEAAPDHPAPEQCQAGCERLAQAKLLLDKKSHQIAVYELDERVDSVKEETTRELALLNPQEAAGETPLDEKALDKLSAKERRAAIDRHDWDEKQLKFQRELAIKRANDALVEARRSYEKAKAEAGAWEKKAVSDLVEACLSPCLLRSAAYGQCFNRLQAVEDAAVCEHL